MSLLLSNPNISDSVSALIGAEADRSASAGTHVEALTALFGVACIDTRFELPFMARPIARLPFTLFCRIAEESTHIKGPAPQYLAFPSARADPVALPSR